MWAKEEAAVGVELYLLVATTTTTTTTPFIETHPLRGPNNTGCPLDNDPRLSRRETAQRDLTFAFDTSSPVPRSCSHICRGVLLPCGGPAWSSRPMMVNVTLKTCSTRAVAHVSSSCFASGTVNSSTVRASRCCRCRRPAAAAAGSPPAGCSAHVSSATRLIPSKGRVVDIPPRGPAVAPGTDASTLEPVGALGRRRGVHGLRRCVLRSNQATFTAPSDMNNRGSA